jgi:hypothetical protein
VACIEDIGGTTVAWRSTRGRAFHGPVRLRRTPPSPGPLEHARPRDTRRR